MTPTAVALRDLLVQVNQATKLLQKSPTVPQEIAELVDSFDPLLYAATPMRLKADPYLTTALFAAAFRSAKALRHDNTAAQRRDLRVALEQFRQALRDIVTDGPYGSDSLVRDVLAMTVDVLAAPQKEVSDLLGVSTRQLQRWLTTHGSGPTGGDAARIRIVGQLVNQLRHTFTGPGVLAWFNREHPVLGVRPATWLGDPIRYPALLSAATASRAMVG